jgi:hypothetical protein
MFSFLTEDGAMWLVQQVLDEAGITDIYPITLQHGRRHRIYCMTDKKNGRDCHSQPGERHKSNVICTLDRDGQLNYTCLAEACGGQRKPVGSWAKHLSDPAGLAAHKPRLVEVGAVDKALRAMSADPAVAAPSYDALQSVFELGHFMVLKPHIFVKLADIFDDRCRNSCDLMHMMNTKELKESHQSIWLLVGQETQRGVKVVDMPFTDLWLPCR